MNTVQRMFLFAAAGMILLAGVVLTGCENDDDPLAYNSAPDVSALTISPSTVTLNFEENYAVLAVSGGTPPYSWSVSDQAMGTVTNVPASSVTYIRSSGVNGVNIIRVTDDNDWAAQATVIQTASTNAVSS